MFYQMKNRRPRGPYRKRTPEEIERDRKQDNIVIAILCGIWLGAVLLAWAIT